ncbi:MAG: exo-alpha-sialidase [Deltaproteobacteria bacterium]|nr:MAG: exo-alpha-sialidase [Deltaproteobacteria bacterium]
MKKKSTSQSAFFNLRVLLASVFCLTGVFLALLGFGTFSAQAQQNHTRTNQSIDPLVPAMFDCSKIHELGIDKQENMRAGAIMIYCGEAQGGAASPVHSFSRLVQTLLTPLAYGTTDVDLVTGSEISPNVTQSETFTASNPDNPNQIVVAYNDSRGRNASPINISGASVSTDGGNTFTRLTTGSGQSPFSNTVGDPVILYNRPTGTWFTVWLDGGCGAQGLGGYKSTTPSNANSWTHYCIHNSNNDDRESGWADNNTSSPFYGRMYVSWNDFNVGGGALFVRYSTDNGLTWTNARQITSGRPFIRDVQITGDLATGDVYIAGMNEGGGGFPHNDSNLIFRSTDGGNTWANTYTGPTFSGPGRSASGYFATMYANPAYWRHEGWGEPAAFNHVVHLVYAARNTGNGDPGDVFYIRSTDSGVTFSAPFMLNTNTDATKAQWQPNVSVNTSGSLLAVWYDERERTAASCQPSSPSTPCYRMWARRSTDNGATWLTDQAFSDVVSPLPLQPDPGIQAVYAGDYDYASSPANQHLHAWVDGRNAISGSSQQDAFHDRQSVSAATPTPTPTATATATATPTATATATATVAPSPTPTATATATASPTSTPTATPGITLSARGYKVQGRQTVDLTWSGATSSTVDIYRNNALIANTLNDGFYTDSIGAHGHGTYTYRVCNAGTQTCSNQVTVTF